MRHLLAIWAVLSWPCSAWHHPGDDECIVWEGRAEPELVWHWATRLPHRLWSILP